MKNKSALLLLIGILALVFSCGKSDVAKPQFKLQVENAPSAKAADDSKSSGVYKGTLVGSTGSFKLTITATEVIGYLRLDDAQYILTTNDIKPSDLGGAIVNALFKDAQNKVQLLFSVDTDGSNPTVSVTVEGHGDISVVVFKETSDQVIKVFEGFLYTTDTSAWVQTKAALNIILGEDTVAQGIYKVIEEYPVVVASNNEVHVRPSDWTSVLYYQVAPYISQDYLWAYKYDTIEGHPHYDYIFMNDYAKYSDNLISGKKLRMINQGHEMWDSVRLVRKL